MGTVYRFPVRGRPPGSIGNQHRDRLIALPMSTGTIWSDSRTSPTMSRPRPCCESASILDPV
ncbi:MAG: hypothetical protein AVDCRST_MAG43-1330 [uncultured Thermomicrobiales bacterium]|uniref:Uncharacterized protein n=1 Tax=uncultured Thermomicrobiales bacterium TaxID=1645740 RepID=A0A6J4ULW0_9BACT|nr:MAG: hypothetical protein AVDCRST_MAG43-1330 [uncultured Thermomicrobiales bacterium]